MLSRIMTTFIVFLNYAYSMADFPCTPSAVMYQAEDGWQQMNI
jgi:hypothetical protein